MFAKLHALFGGTSPWTGYIGSILVIGDVLQLVFLQHGLPTNALGWLAFGGALLTGLGLRFAKDENKSNAPNPVPTPKTVGS